MREVHAEYIAETPSFVHVSMDITPADANKSGYGPWTLRKAEEPECFSVHEIDCHRFFFTEVPADVMIILSKVQKKLKGHSFHPRRVYDDLAEHEDLVHRDDDERVPAPLDARVKVAAARARDAVP